MLAERSDRTASTQVSRVLDDVYVFQTSSAASGPTTTRFEPVPIEHDGYYTLEDRVSGVFGSGASAEDAIEDFRSAIAEHRDVLERQEALSPALERQLDYLRSITL